MSRNTANDGYDNSQPTLTKEKIQPTLTNVPPPSNAPTFRDRDDNGRFIKGNRGGPGNPSARHCARMLDLFRTAISDEAVVQLCRMLFEKAVNGDVSAAKLVLAYKIGKPLACPDPDGIDRDEWDHYQQDAIEPEEMKLVLSSLPARVGNDIARTALPIMTDERTHELPAQLQRDCAVSHEGVEKHEDRCEKSVKCVPLPNGDLDDGSATRKS